MAYTQSVFNRLPFLIRLLHWEYWPFNLVYAPVALYFVWLMLRARSLFFFSASNPTIETGGMFGESKWEIFKLIPQHLYPSTIFVAENSDLENVKKQMLLANIQYPVIAKPDRGERGWLVSKIENDTQLNNYLNKVKASFLIQTCVNLPVEMSVFYYRFPDKERGFISSVTLKEMLSVTGDGTSTLKQLILNYPRALLQLKVLETELGERLNSVPRKNEKIELVPFGNHSRGSKFTDGCHLIDDEMTAVFDTLSKSIAGFYFGRYDIRCSSIEMMKEGKNIQILELNGAGAEPAHIYQPGFSLFTAYGVLFYHFYIMYKISLMNHKNGVRYMTLKEFMQMRKTVKDYKLKAQP